MTPTPTRGAIRVGQSSAGRDARLDPAGYNLTDRCDPGGRRDAAVVGRHHPLIERRNA
jgi:hypothetical protein